MKSITQYQPKTTYIHDTFRWMLGILLLSTGVGHLTFSRQEFQAQVPSSIPLDADLVVVLSGILELVLGVMLVALPKYRSLVGWIVAIFFVAIFPGNISQYINGKDAFGLDTDEARFFRLFLQPVLIAWALWSTGAWKAWSNRHIQVKSEAT